MAEDAYQSEKKDRGRKVVMRNGRNGWGGGYGLGVIGALVYYWQQATTFWMVVWGLLKAIFWPAFLVYHLLKFLHM